MDWMQYLFIDEIPDEDSNEPAIYIYTRPFDFSTVKFRDSLEIYTTAALRSVMIYDERNLSMRDQIKLLNEDDVPFAIVLPNKKTMWAQLFSCNSKTMNVVVLLQCDGNYLLHAGRFISSNSTLFKGETNRCLREVMRGNRVDVLCIDSTSAHICESNMKRTACQDIKSLLKSKDFKDHKFEMLIDDFGYEDLLFMLAKDGIRIFLGEKRAKIFKKQDVLHHFCDDPNEAHIIIVDELPRDIEKRFVEERIVSIKFEPQETLSYSKALHFIQYSNYPTMADIYHIASLAAPSHILSIGPYVDLRHFQLQT